MKKILSSCLVAGLLATGCAPSSEKVSASYVSPMHYQDFSCKQIRMEMTRLSRRVNEVADVQDSHASKDGAAMGVGLVLFWPALFFMIGKDKEEELARLKGEYEALESAAIQKECDVAKEVEAARKLQEERQKAKEEKQKQYQSNNHQN